MGRVAFAVFAGVTLAGASSALATCPAVQPQPLPGKKAQAGPPCVSLGALPEISAQVVAGEPAPVVKRPAYEGLPSNTYNGPRLGLTKPDPAVRPVPTVGFRWSLE